jgi:thioredoxin 1
MRSIKMKYFGIITVLYLSLLPLEGSEVSSTVNPSSSPKPRTVNQLYPGLTTGAMSCAAASTLPEGVVLRAGEIVIENNELIEEIGKAPEQMRPKLKKHAFFVLEQIATIKLLLAEARAEAVKGDKDISEKDEQAIIQDYLRALAKTAKVSEAEILDFYNGNTEMFDGASLVQIKPQIEQFLLQQKQQELINEHIRMIGRRMQIEISSSWLKVQAVLARDNPVDKARASGRASLVDFGSSGCVPCDMMAPILETLREKYNGKVNVIFIHVGEEPMLASRYGVQSIPVQIFFDKTGKEVFRHVGFFAQEQIEGKLSEMRVK